MSDREKLLNLLTYLALGPMRSQRVCQIIGNALMTIRDVYYVEDGALQRNLLAFCAQHKVEIPEELR